MRLAFRVCLALGAAPALTAQQPGDTVTLTPVVVTATRLPTAADAVPAAVTVISGAALRAQGVSTVYDALREVPGAAVVQSGSFGAVTSLFLRGGQSDYVKVLVDGVPVNQPGGAFDFANLTTANVERIEVVRGPASVLYGSDAVTGVVQIFTRRGVGAGRADASVRGGTYGTLVWDAEAAGGGADASYSFAASRFTTNGIYAFNNQYDNTVLSGLVRVAPDDRTEATLSLRYDDNHFHFPTNSAGDTVDHRQFNYGSGPTIGLDIGHYFAPRLETRLLLALNETDGGLDDRPDNPADSTLFQSLDNVRRASADLRANLYLRSGTVLTGGAVLEQERDRGFDVCQTSFGPCSSPPIDSSRWNAAVYAQAVTTLANGVALTGGVRVEDNQRFGTYATYRLGAVYRLAGGTRVRASAGTGFREPSFFENYSTGYSVGNPALRPEHSRSWELGVEQAVSRARATVFATFFDQRFVDMIDYNPAAPPNVPNYENVAGATVDGLECGARVTATSSLALALSYTYLSTNVTRSGFDSSSGAALAAGQPLIRRPRHSARLDADYRIPDRGAVSLAVGYVGDRVDRDFAVFPAPRVILPSYTRVDLGVQLDVVQPQHGAPGLGVRARVENLFDRAYEEVKNFPARRRTLLFGGEVRFGT
ncbi:MAG TPA: TonB-dependent receptor [Gemmatimonadales bacterium]|nr:TonB-dependent receptor [Gemmatimonadales bacterium]